MNPNTPQQLRILVAPLDWGLGHATRCIPLIRFLLHDGHTVVLATDGPQRALLQQEFPQLECLELEGYGITYATKGLVWGLLAQAPKLVKAIADEHRWLQDSIHTQRLDLVISDNRYGLYSSAIPCVLITHQLQLQLPTGFHFAKGLVRSMLYRYINRFTACWVPDVASPAASLSGAMGHPTTKPKIPVAYLGWLSRFTALPKNPVPQYEVLVVLSGPEPQRTIFENLLLPQIRRSGKRTMLVRGLPGNADNLPDLPPQVVVHNHLNAADLQAAFLNSSLLISRSGYSTVMDAFTLAMRCIFVPTPGQTEQEYLAKSLAQKRLCLCRPQQHFNLEEAIAALQQADIAAPGHNETNGRCENAG